MEAARQRSARVRQAGAGRFSCIPVGCRPPVPAALCAGGLHAPAAAGLATAGSGVITRALLFSLLPPVRLPSWCLAQPAIVPRDGNKSGRSTPRRSEKRQGCISRKTRSSRGTPMDLVRAAECFVGRPAVPSRPGRLAGFVVHGLLPVLSASRLGIVKHLSYSRHYSCPASCEMYCTRGGHKALPTLGALSHTACERL